MPPTSKLPTNKEQAAAASEEVSAAIRQNRAGLFGLMGCATIGVASIGFLIGGVEVVRQVGPRLNTLVHCALTLASNVLTNGTLPPAIG